MIALLGAIAAGACANQASQRDQLDEAVHRFNSDVRWRRWDQAAGRMPLGMQDAFLARQDALGSQVDIDDVVIDRVELASGGALAVAQVDVSWDRVNEQVVHTSTIREQWRRDRQLWHLVRLEQVSGETLPFLVDAGPITAPVSEPASQRAP